MQPLQAPGTDPTPPVLGETIRFLLAAEKTRSIIQLFLVLFYLVNQQLSYH
jgi:hypothetical protein